MADFELELVPVLADNYVYLVREPDSGAVAVVDPSVAEPVIAALEARGWTPQLILNTHHHPDHVGGNEEIKARYSIPVAAPAADAHRIPGIDRELAEGDSVAIGDAQGRVIAVPGHTSGHIALHFKDQKALFCGDTLFSLGCGRLFEGTPEQMWESLSKLKALPDETMVCCAHEYTEQNGRFALSVDPDNDMLATRMKEVRALRSQDQPSVPSSLGVEKGANPFLRPGDRAIRGRLGMTEASDIEVFAEIRRRKDSF